MLTECETGSGKEQRLRENASVFFVSNLKYPAALRKVYYVQIEDLKKRYSILS